MEVLSFRPLLFSIAYNMTGNIEDAEDIVQDTFLAWAKTDHPTVQSPKSYLCRMAIHKSVDRLAVKKKERETYPGTWLAEPVIEYPEEQSGIHSELLSQGLMMVLERLNPVQRAVYLLREIFGFDYEEIAGFLDKTEANCRQILRRARIKIQSDKGRQQPSREKLEQLFSAFMAANSSGNLQPLIEMLRDDVSLYSDGGGKATAAMNPLFGKEVCSRFIQGIFKLVPEGISYQSVRVNGVTGILAVHGNIPYSLIAIEFDSAGEIEGIYITRNPDKLKNIIPIP